MIELKKCQEDACEKLVERLTEALEGEDQNITLFKAPTGTGKTVVMAKVIDELTKLNMPICYFWLSIGKGGLEEQSYKSLKNNLTNKVSLWANEFNGNRDRVEQNEIVVANWELLNSDKNKANQDTEKYNFIDVLNNTKEKGLEIVLVIDEAHHSAATKKALAVREKLAPKITIEVSATPLSKAHDSQVKIMAKQAVRDGLLKKKVIINNKVKNDGKLKANEQILTLAVEKHEQNKLGYAKENRGLPLTIIAIPDGKNKDVKAEVLEFLKSKSATTKNGKVAVYMSEDKTEGYDTLNTADSTVEFVLCKQAIATGWDCPRACNMVYFRDSDNIVFNTQLFGRILRMPNQLPFENDDLNYAYVFTTNDEILIDTDEDSEELIFEDNKTKKTEVKVSLSSYLIEKINQDIVVGSNFKKHFNKQFESHGVK